MKLRGKMTPKSEQRIFYVYCLYRPTGEPVYIGKGKGKRWLAKRAMVKNPHLARIAIAAGGTLRSEKILENLTEQEALDAEIAFIKQIGRLKHGGPLVNLTDGGDGTSGRLQTEEAKARIGRANTGRKFSQECIERRVRTHLERLTPELRKRYAWFTGKKHTPETKARMSASYRPRILTPEQRAYASSSRAGKPQNRTPEHAANLRAAIQARNMARRGIKKSGGTLNDVNQISLAL